MHVLRTPDSCFARLAGYPFAPRYAKVVAGDTRPLRMHYLDEGDPAGQPVVLLHGNPTWSYLYRTMIPPLAEAGHRVLAPDLIGMGRSDKPAQPRDYTYLRHVEWVTSWIDELDLRDVTLFVQDWGSLIGLRVAAEQSHRIARLVVANGTLLTAAEPLPFAVKAGLAIARHIPYVPAAGIVAHGTVNTLSAQVRAGYDAPFPNRRYQAGTRAFPRLVPASPRNPAVPANRAAWNALGRWDKPFLAIFGTSDPIFGQADHRLISHIPGAAGQPHARIHGGHFVPEDCGAELASRLNAWMSSTA